VARDTVALGYMVGLDESRRFAPAVAVSWTDAGDELVIFDRGRGTYHALNGSASAIWRALGVGRSADAVTRLLGERYAADVADDVAQFFATAAAAGLITEVAG
jgi:hypothetical protein